MTAPVPYVITTNFEDDEVGAVSGRSTVRTAQVDVELQNIATSIQSIIDNADLIQRDDGELADGSVKINSLSAEVLSLLSGTTIVPRGDWSAASVVYSVGNLVRYAVDSHIYICLQDHTSSGGIPPTTATHWQVWSYAFGTDAQLLAISALSPSADQLQYWTGLSTAALTGFTATARALLDDASTTAMLATLGAPSLAEALTPVMTGRIGAGDSSGGYLGGDGNAPRYFDSTGQSTQDSTSGGYIFMGGFDGWQIALYDGANWRVLNFDSSTGGAVNPTVAVPAVANQMYDVFAYYNAGASATGFVSLELVAWSSDTVRSASLICSGNPGFVYKFGDSTRRYVGTVRTGASAGVVPDTPAQRYVWNAFNRVPKRLFNYPSGLSWNYSVDTFREMNGATTARCELINPGITGALAMSINAIVSNSSATGQRCQIGMGLNSTSAPHVPTAREFATSGQNRTITTSAVMSPAFGHNFVAPLERGAGADTQTWYGTNAGAELAVGMSGIWWC